VQSLPCWRQYSLAEIFQRCLLARDSLVWDGDLAIPSKQKPAEDFCRRVLGRKGQALHSNTAYFHSSSHQLTFTHTDENDQLTNG
jgi:hypothetical protein